MNAVVTGNILSRIAHEQLVRTHHMQHQTRISVRIGSSLHCKQTPCTLQTLLRFKCQCCSLSSQRKHATQNCITRSMRIVLSQLRASLARTMVHTLKVSLLCCVVCIHLHRNSRTTRANHATSTHHLRRLVICPSESEKQLDSCSKFARLRNSDISFHNNSKQNRRLHVFWSQKFSVLFSLTCSCSESADWFQLRSESKARTAHKIIFVRLSDSTRTRTFLIPSTDAQVAGPLCLRECVHARPESCTF